MKFTDEQWALYKPRTWLSIHDLTTFKRCPRKFFFNTGCLLAQGEHDHPALTFGECIHVAAPIVIEQGLDAGYRAFSEVWGTWEADDKRNPFGALRILTDFHEAHKDGGGLYELVEPPTQFRISQRVNKYEIPFALDIGGHVPFVGRLDGLCRLRANGTLWVLEYKTTSEMSARFFQAFDLSSQIIAYTMYMRIAHPQEPTHGAVVEGLRVSKTNAATQAQPIFVKDHECERMLSWIRRTMREIQWCEENREFDESYSGCHPYDQFGSHGYQCEFAQLCHQPDFMPLVGLYRKKEDRPYDLLINGKPLEDRKELVAGSNPSGVQLCSSTPSTSKNVIPPGSTMSDVVSAGTTIRMPL